MNKYPKELNKEQQDWVIFFFFYFQKFDHIVSLVIWITFEKNLGNNFILTEVIIIFFHNLKIRTAQVSCYYISLDI